MSGSRRGGRPRLVAVVLLAVITGGLVGTVVIRSWQSADRGRHATTLERSGVAFLRPGIGLLAALAGAEVTVGRGVPVNPGQVQAAENAVDAAAGAQALGTTARWNELRSQVDALTRRSDSGAGAAQAWSDAVGMAQSLLDAVAATSGLDLDPDAAAHSLAAAAAHDLPAVIVYTGRAGDIAARVGGGSPSAAQETALVVDTFQVALLAARVDTGLTGGADAASDLTTQVDAFESAVGGFAPPSVVTRPVGSVPVVGLADSAQTVQASALALATDLLARVDTALAGRQGTQREDGVVALAVGIAVLVSAAALVWLLAPVRRRDDTGPDVEVADEPEPVPADLIDARDLPFEELVHIGRGVRAPTATRGSGTDAR